MEKGRNALAAWSSIGPNCEEDKHKNFLYKIYLKMRLQCSLNTRPRLSRSSMSSRLIKRKQYYLTECIRNHFHPQRINLSTRREPAILWILLGIILQRSHDNEMAQIRSKAKWRLLNLHQSQVKKSTEEYDVKTKLYKAKKNSVRGKISVGKVSSVKLSSTCKNTFNQE